MMLLHGAMKPRVTHTISNMPNTDIDIFLLWEIVLCDVMFVVSICIVHIPRNSFSCFLSFIYLLPSARALHIRLRDVVLSVLFEIHKFVSNYVLKPIWTLFLKLTYLNLTLINHVVFTTTPLGVLI